ncbi:hypothetical protein, partial [Streptomyces sp. BK340]|uniref:hypothetical protein n=1 Tax=Streptomyces sp. BK340 TaxID=2572903 RepID=UPI0011AD770B
PPGALPRLPDANAALAWFRSEESTIRALIDATTSGTEHERSSQLAHTCDTLATRAGRPTDRTSLAAQHTDRRAHHTHDASNGLHETRQHTNPTHTPHHQPHPDEETPPATGTSHTGLVFTQ